MIKYLTAVLITVSTIACFSLNIYAASAIEITSLEQTSDGVVQVICSISDAEDDQNITVISCEENDQTYTEDVVYIDQFIPEISEEFFSFEFMPADWVISGKSYIVRVGGSGITEPAELGIIYLNGYIILYGDANGDGNLTAADAAYALQYVLNNSFHDSDTEWINIIDVDGSGDITAADAAYILQKVLNASFVFPIE